MQIKSFNWALLVALKAWEEEQEERILNDTVNRSRRKERKT